MKYEANCHEKGESQIGSDKLEILAEEETEHWSIEEFKQIIRENVERTTVKELMWNERRSFKESFKM